MVVAYMSSRMSDDQKDARFLVNTGGKILQTIQKGICTVRRISQEIDKAQAAISKNLHRLHEMGLVEVMKNQEEIKKLDMKRENKRTVRGQKKPYKLTASGQAYLKVFTRYKNDELKKRTLDFVKSNRQASLKMDKEVRDYVDRIEVAKSDGLDFRNELRGLVNIANRFNQKGVFDWAKQKQVISLIESFTTMKLEDSTKEQAIRLTGLAMPCVKHNLAGSAMVTVVQPWLVQMAMCDTGNIGAEALLALSRVRTFYGTVPEEVLDVVLSIIWYCLGIDEERASCMQDLHVEALVTIFPDLDDVQRVAVIRSSSMIRANSVEAFLNAIKMDQKPSGKLREIEQNRLSFYRSLLGKILNHTDSA